MTRRVPDDALALLRESQDRVLEREGIPMLLALVDELADDPAGPEPHTAAGSEAPSGPQAAHAADGARLAGSMEQLWQALAPSARDGDLGRVGTVLQAAAYLDFGQGRTLL